MPGTAVVVFTRDLRLHDHPALTAALGAARVVPLFVVDDAIVDRAPVAAARWIFLLDALADLRDALRTRGGDLVIRRGDWAAEVARVAHEHDAATVHVTTDVTTFATRRLGALERALQRERRALVRHPGLFVVEPGTVVPTGRDHYSVFTPYHRSWRAAPRRGIARTPRRVPVPSGLRVGRLPGPDAFGVPRRVDPGPAGGERAARRRYRAWVRSAVEDYGDARDRLGDDATSHLSAAFHFGCLSPAAVVRDLEGTPAAAPFVRQIAWRDFFAQVLAARPDAAWADYRKGPRRWRDDPDGFAAWCEGRTGYPLVDAAMRQLDAESYVHNRARMVAASFLTKDLGVDWRVGARHFLDRLVDGDVASNNLSWQWVAGTGTGAHPSRVLNPIRQAHRFDADGRYVRRHVRELRALRAPAVLDPGPDERARSGYPGPIVDHDSAVDDFRARIA